MHDSRGDALVSNEWLTFVSSVVYGAAANSECDYHGFYTSHTETPLNDAALFCELSKTGRRVE